MAEAQTKKKNPHPLLRILIITAVTVIIGGLAMLFTLSGKEETPAEISVEEDSNMTTNQYTTDITLLDNGGTSVTEHIDVSFKPERHGIYRYINKTGTLNYKLNNQTKSEYYYGFLSVKDSNVTYETSNDGTYGIIKFGDADKTVTEQVYDFTYEIEPTMNTQDFQVAYMNIFPSRWQNKIPAGSSFTIHFPKGYEKDNLQFYTGGYGSDEDATSILELTYNDNEVMGTLTKDLELGSGVTLFADMGEGYYSSITSADNNVRGDVNILIFVLITSIILFLLFGFSPKPVTSIQYTAPAGQDSATIGFILDGVVDDKDISSLFLYWANQGTIQIKENSSKELVIVKLKNLPGDAPKHQTLLFDELFASKSERNIAKLGTKHGYVINKAKAEIKNSFTAKGSQGSVYAKISTIPRRIALFLCCVPMFVYVAGAWGYSNSGLSFTALAAITIGCNIFGIWKMNSNFRKWNSMGNEKRILQLIISILFMVVSLSLFVITDRVLAERNMALNYVPGSIWIILGTPVAALFATNIRRRTKKGTELMGWILGIRDFIKTAELDRINAMAEEHPDWFYHLLPYAYVLGLTDTWVHRLDALGVEIPDPTWYAGTNDRNQIRLFDSFQNKFDVVETTIASSVAAATAAQAAASAGAESGSSSSSGDSGGFSGGGIGGGGGGSW